MSQIPDPQSILDYQNTIADLRYQLQVAEDTLEAIRTGSVDALAVQENGVTKIFTLEGADQTYRVLIENMSEGAVTLNQQGLILYANAQFARLINLSLNEVIGASFYQFVPEEYHSVFIEIFTQGWHQPAKKELVLQPVQAIAVHVYLSLTAIESLGETVLGLIITNLSEQKELERLTQTQEELFKKNEELLRINYDLDTFVYTASHDLKTPIVNIEGLINALEDVIGESAPQETVKIIIRLMAQSVGHFKSTILDLTEISKVQKNLSGIPETINCQEIIKEINASLREAIAQSEADIKVEIVNCEEIQFSKKNFHSILYNLISNAIKYHSPDRRPQIVISLTKKPNYVVLCVEDNGLGINLKYQPKLFSMFERLHDHVEGSGIGLYIVKRIIDNAGGKITVESVEGKGSTFRVYLPVV